MLKFENQCCRETQEPHLGMFTVVALILAKIQMQPKCLLTVEWINKLWHVRMQIKQKKKRYNIDMPTTRDES